MVKEPIVRVLWSLCAQLAVIAATLFGRKYLNQLFPLERKWTDIDAFGYIIMGVCCTLILVFAYRRRNG